MKKLAIAGASLALAAMPVVGVLADDDLQVVDTIQITVGATCSFNTNNSSSMSDTTYSATVENGAEASFNNSGTHKFNVSCNDSDGWTVTATPTALAGTAASGNASIPFVLASTYGTTPSGTDGKWTATIVAGTGSPTVNAFGTNATVVATKTASTDNADFTVTYKAYVGTATPADTYTGTMTYVLGQL